MPELAEVEHFRRRWSPGLNRVITRLHLHDDKRIFRGVDTAGLRSSLVGARLVSSEAHGKQMCFRTSKGQYLGIHLGMTGHLEVSPPRHAPSKHEHLVIYQKELALVFSDPRQFGRVLFDQGPAPPAWWSSLPPAIISPQFSQAWTRGFLARHGRLPLKAALLLQKGFPGLGNWMVDEILWRAGIAPATKCGSLSPEALKKLHRQIKWVARGSLQFVAPAHGDLPPGWLFNERWTAKGHCPGHHIPLSRATIGGRTTVWCPRCQPG